MRTRQNSSQINGLPEQAVVFLFFFFLGWLLSKEDIG
jgi:hypothetical protein